MLINDVDLLRVEPRLFTDAASVATLLVDGSDGGTSGTTFTSALSDFVTEGIDTGNVLVAGSETLEIDSRTNATTLEVSRPRVDDMQNLISPNAGSALAFSVRTFERQIAESQQWVLGALGIESQHPDQPLDENAIVDVEPIERLIALRVTAHVYSLASAINPTDTSLVQLAQMYKNLASIAKQQAVVYLDLDGDGIPDSTRRIDVVTFIRR